MFWETLVGFFTLLFGTGLFVISMAKMEAEKDDTMIAIWGMWTFVGVIFIVLAAYILEDTGGIC